MKINEYNGAMKHIARRPTSETIKKAINPEGKPMPILDYIKKMNSLYSNYDESEDPRYVPPAEMEDIKKSLPVSEMVKKEERFNDKILKRDKYETPKKQIIKKTLIVEKPKPQKPPIINLLELEDWLNELDKNWWEEEHEPAPWDEKVLLQVPRSQLKGIASIMNLHKKLA